MLPFRLADAPHTQQASVALMVMGPYIQFCVVRIARLDGANEFQKCALQSLGCGQPSWAQERFSDSGTLWATQGLRLLPGPQAFSLRVYFFPETPLHSDSGGRISKC